MLRPTPSDIVSQMPPVQMPPVRGLVGRNASHALARRRPHHPSSGAGGANRFCAGAAAPRLRAIPTELSASAWTDDGKFAESEDDSSADARVARPPFPWDDYDRCCHSFVDEPLRQFIHIRKHFLNADDTRPTTDQHWSFFPTAVLNDEMRDLRTNFLRNTFPMPTEDDKLDKQRALENQAYDDALMRYNKLNEGFVVRGCVAAVHVGRVLVAAAAAAAAAVGGGGGGGGGFCCLARLLTPRQPRMP